MNILNSSSHHRSQVAISTITFDVQLLHFRHRNKPYATLIY